MRKKSRAGIGRPEIRRVLCRMATESSSAIATSKIVHRRHPHPGCLPGPAHAKLIGEMRRRHSGRIMDITQYRDDVLGVDVRARP